MLIFEQKVDRFLRLATERNVRALFHREEFADSDRANGVRVKKAFRRNAVGGEAAVVALLFEEPSPAAADVCGVFAFGSGVPVPLEGEEREARRRDRIVRHIRRNAVGVRALQAPRPVAALLLFEPSEPGGDRFLGASVPAVFRDQVVFRSGVDATGKRVGHLDSRLLEKGRVDVRDERQLLFFKDDSVFDLEFLRNVERVLFRFVRVEVALVFGEEVELVADFGREDRLDDRLARRREENQREDNRQGDVQRDADEPRRDPPTGRNVPDRLGRKARFVGVGIGSDRTVERAKRFGGRRRRERNASRRRLRAVERRRRGRNRHCGGD